MDGSVKHYVGVYDPETGEMQVVEARGMSVRGTLRSEEEEVRRERRAKHDGVSLYHSHISEIYGS